MAAKEETLEDIEKRLAEQRKLLEKREEEKRLYDSSLKDYEFKTADYKRAQEDYQKALDLYNKREKVLGDVAYWSSNYGATPYNLGMTYSADENRRKNQLIRDAGLTPGSSGLYDTSFFFPESDLYEFQITRGSPGGVISYGDLYKRGGAKPGEFTAQAPEEFKSTFDLKEYQKFVDELDALQKLYDERRFVYPETPTPEPTPVAPPPPVDEPLPRAPGSPDLGDASFVQDPKGPRPGLADPGTYFGSYPEVEIPPEVVTKPRPALSDPSTYFGSYDQSLFDRVKKEAMTGGSGIPKLPGSMQLPYAQPTYGAPDMTKFIKDKSKEAPEQADPNNFFGAYDRSLFDQIKQEALASARPLVFEKGGEVSNEDFIEQMTVGTRPTDQGPVPYDQTAAAQFADYLRAPVDLAQTAVRGTIGAVVGPAYGLYKGVTGGKYGTPEGVREASSEAGELMQKITGEPQSKAAKDFLQFLGEKAEALKLAPMPQLMTAPIPGRGAVRFQGEAAKGAVEDIALRAVRSQTENPDITAAQLYNAMLGKQAPGAAAVKPRGGIALTTEGSPLGNYIEDVIKSVNQDNYRTTVPEDKRAEVADFIAKKMPKYISRDFGTENDPIRQAVLEGRINLFGRDKEKLRRYALAAARADDPEALEDVTMAYDRGTGLRPYLITPDTEDYRVTRDAKEKAVESLVQKMVAEGADENTARSIVSERLEGISLKDLEAAAKEEGDIRSNFATSAQVLAAFGGKDQADFIRRAVEQGDVAYGMSRYNLLDMFDSEAVAKTIGAVPLEKLSRMSFPEAFIEGTNVLKLTRDFDVAVETARRGKGNTLPKEVLSFGTKPLSKSTSGNWLQITDPNAARLEGALMGHSVGGYGEDGNYNLGGKKALLSGKANLFSLRDEKGLPIATVEMEDMGKREGGAPDLKIKQVQGRYNSAPEDYLDDVFKLAKEVNGRWPTGPAGVQRYMTDRTGKGLEQPVEIRWNDLYLRYLQSQEPDKKAAGGEVTKFIRAHA